MRRTRQRHSQPASAGFRSSLTLLLLGGLLAFSGRAHGQVPPLITHLAQLSRALALDRQFVADARFQATVFACDTNTGALALQDDTGAELLELEGLSTSFNPGDQIVIDSKQLLFVSSDVGTYVSKAPIADNDGVHGSKAVATDCTLTPGRHRVRLDWFNQVLGQELSVSCQPADADASDVTSPAPSNLLHAVSAQCFQGCWFNLPNFQLLLPVKSGDATNFDIRFRTRDEMVGIRFEGYLDVPAQGHYRLRLRSDDGSRLWIDDPSVPVQKIASASRPPAPQVFFGAPVGKSDERHLATLQGRVNFASSSGKGMRLDLRSEQGAVSVLIANSGSLSPANLVNATVRVSGVTGNVLTLDQRPVLGSVALVASNDLIILENSPDKENPAPPLRTIAQIHNLSSNELARELPVEIRGIVTSVATGINDWIVVQDDTRGTFVSLAASTTAKPEFGELWSISGRTQPGGFAPTIIADKATRLGKGLQPDPVHPTWSQLVNGSMDVQWAEIEGVVTEVFTNRLTLLLPEGHQSIDLPGWGGSELRPLDKALVRIRGTLFATWNGRTHEAIVGKISMYNASISVERPAPNDPFDAPEKSPRGLFRFDARASSLQPVKVLGQVTYADNRQVFLEANAGLQVYPSGKVDLKAGDTVEAVGYPALYGPGAQLREAILRIKSHDALPVAPSVSDASFPADAFALKRIRLVGKLADLRSEGDSLALQIQTRTHLMLAFVANGRPLNGLRLGSQLALTAVYVPPGLTEGPSIERPHFDLLINSPDDVVLLSAPSWWTLQRLLSVVGALSVTLALASVWIALLRRQVSQRSLRLQLEIREREHAERQHALESERSRIARDLHDELGSGLTEMSMLASADLEEIQPAHPATDRLRRIADKARTLVAGLDIIVWAIDPRRNSLQSFADYLECYAEELLSASGIHCRFKIPVECKAASLTGAARHSLLLAVKETLTNIIRHASATVVELEIAQPDDRLEITIMDNGRGFVPDAASPGDGLLNLRERMAALHGNCQVDTAPGKGTTVKLIVPLAESPCLTGAK